MRIEIYFENSTFLFSFSFTVTRTWREIREDTGSRPPSLQQHTMIASGGKLIVFGGELCMSNDCPLWIYDLQVSIVI